ncbi:MAG: phosphatidate cytidylyltransferase [Tissierellia bacterium]|nr:phosphatidate cytidylyltransferase [Tissierellia bacterium]
MSDLKVRLISGIIGLVLLIGLILIGGLPFKIALLLCSLIGLLELSNALKKIDIEVNIHVAITGVLLLFAELVYRNSISTSLYLVFYLVCFSFLILNKSFIESTALLFSLIYIPVSFFTMGMIDNTVYIGLIFVIAFATDSFAYFVGSAIGKHKLAPAISPNKSVEVAIGGILGSVALSFIYLKLFAEVEIIKVLALSIIGSIISQSGDLVASRIKRTTGVKDFGKLIPGHGGIMDRFDSVIMLTPIIYVIYTHFIV